MKILILAVPVGTGHIKAARAISQALARMDSKAIVRYENCFNWVYPLYGYVYTKIYDFGQKKAGKILEFFYNNTGGNSGSSELFYKVHKAIADRFVNLIREFKPDYVLCTHWSPGYFAALYKNDYHYKIGVVVTDYYIHPHWVNNEIDHYFIPHEYLIEQALSYGAGKEKIFPFGIPVGFELGGKIDKDAARGRFGLSKNRVSVVVMGSKVFGGEWFEIVREIIDFDYDLLVLCGENEEVKDKIKKLKGRANLSTYGMVKHIHELIDTCDILITKAGGITTTEATKAGSCLIFANSIVGLEDKNEDFFIRHNAAVKITKHNAKQILSDLLAHPKKMEEMRKNLKGIGKKYTSRNIAKVISGSDPYEKREI